MKYELPEAPCLAKLLLSKHQILYISGRFSNVERPVCQRQGATPVSKIPREDKHKHTKQLHQTLQGGRQRLLVRRGPVWIRVLLRQRTTARYVAPLYVSLAVLSMLK